MSDFDQLYIKRAVDIDKKPIEINQLEDNRTKRIVKEVIFLRYLVKSTVDLFSYKDEDYKTHFFYQKSNEIKELNLVKFRMGTKLVKFEEYKQQLKNLIADCQVNLKTVSYTEQSLTRIFKEYNQCIGGAIESKPKAAGVNTFFNIILGVSFNSMTHKGNDNYGAGNNVSSKIYNSTTTPIFGLAINFKKEKSRTINFGAELLWRDAGTYSSNTVNPSTLSTTSIEISAKYLHGNFMAKYSFLRNSIVMPYLKAGIGGSYLLSFNGVYRYKSSPGPEFIADPILNLSTTGYNFVGGLGCATKRIYGEVRFDQSLHGTSNGIVGNNTISSFSLVVGYQINK